jgi:hypothetical protein
MSPIDHRSGAALQAAANRIKRTVIGSAERAVTSLGQAALAATSVAERDALLGAQFDFERGQGRFAQRFAEVLDEKFAAALAPRGAAASTRSSAWTDWQSLSLVQDDEVEQIVSADRLGQAITLECEWELRELSTYVGALLRSGQAERETNPLRPEIVGKALARAIEEVSPERERRALLGRELARALAAAMKACYADIIEDLRLRGVEPVGLSVKTVVGPGHARDLSRHSAYGTTTSPEGHQELGLGEEMFGLPSSGVPLSPAIETRPDSRRGALTSRPGELREADSQRGRASDDAPHGTPLGSVEPQMMTLIRRLARLGGRGSDAGGLGSALTDIEHAARGSGFGPAPSGLMAPNQIHAHRDELHQAATGALDHMVIDVVASLFDQILSDPKVPPQMARQIARLQLPVLRVALGDVSFFSSRRHPVRRFVNRIASLACAFEDFTEGPGLEFVARVRDLVQQIVEGDFDQMEVYEAKLSELEDFIRQQTAGDVQHKQAATLLHDKETELRLQQRYMQMLQSGLAPLAVPEFIRDFLAQVWSQAIMAAVTREGAHSEAAKRRRLAGRELAMSVQPKGAPPLRKAFLLKLPKLMKELNEGLDAVGWPAAAKKDFFAQLLPAHSESLKGQPLSELSYNLLASEIDSLLARPVPQAGELSRSAEPLPELTDVVLDNRFSQEEAEQIGLVPESAVDWSGSVDIEVGLEAADPAEAADADIHIDGLPPADPPEPNEGLALMEQVQIGFAYRMLLKERWQKVRLSYVSPGRAFFVFTHGKKHQETISMTARMLARMCETNRLRPFENAYLIERATARARKQLAGLKSAATRH